MKSIAFYNNKGGVGKTTSAINIAYELAKNSKVLIIDVDGQANCSRFFTEKLKEGLDKAFVNTEVLPETALCHTRYDNIDIITATPAATPYQHSNTKLNINACFIGNRHNLNHR